MKRFASAVVLAAFTVAACQTVPISGTTTPTGPRAIPSGDLDLGGDWRRASISSVLSRFQESVAERYGAGAPLSAVAGDLRRNDFTCAANRDGGRGDPADQICRKTETAGECTHTWQVHLYDASENGVLARTRGLYDRRCGGDGLLGGPG